MKTRYLIAILCGVMSLAVAGCGPSDDAGDGPDWNKMAAVNSRFVPAEGDMRTAVWAVMQARILADGSGVGGFCGTAWICDVTPETVTFAAAAHELNSDTFHSTVNDPVRVMVFLANADGRCFAIRESALETFREKDLVLVRVPHPGDKTLRPLKMSDKVQSRDVYNLGFPDRAGDDVRYSIKLDPPYASFDKGPWMQRGGIASAGLANVTARDVILRNVVCIKLDYTSEPGFSGGPLFSQEDGSVIGMMVMVVPPKDGTLPTTSVALSATEVRKTLGK